jgi:type IV pilus assembly protein PilN
MIKINLLPVRATKKKEAVQRHVLVFVAGLVAILVIGGVSYVAQAKSLGKVQRETSELQKEITGLKTLIGKVDEYRKQKEILERKLGVIGKLEADKTGPVHMLDELASRIPEKLWVESLQEAGGRVTLEGVSINHEVIATFLTRLDESIYFDEVYLVSIEASKDKTDLRLKRYKITARLVVPNATEVAKSAETKPNETEGER